MKKKNLYRMVVLPFLLVLAACSGVQLPWAAKTTTQTEQNQAPDFANQPIEMRLAVGTLQLEGTDQAVTAQQAAELLPLWKAVKALSSSSTAAPDEIRAVYRQIQEAMTPEQIQAIQEMQIAPQDFQALMKQYGVQMPQGGSGGPGGLSDSERATRVAGFRAQSGSGNSNGGNQVFQGGGLPGGGMPGGGFPGGGFPQEGNGTVQRAPRAQGTPQPGSASRAFRGGMNNLFVDPLIKLLQERAGK